MKHIITIIILVALALPLFIPIGDVVGYIRIHGLSAEVRTDDIPNCCCCPPLWNGGIATTPADLSTVRLYDTATLTTLDGTRLVLECVEITPCIRWGRWLLGWQGVLSPNGDVLIVSRGMIYRWTRL